MKRREFEVLLGAVVAGILSGAGAGGEEKPVAEVKGPKHVCKGLNECRGQGECKHGCGNNGCHGKNDCKGRGGCEVPLKIEHTTARQQAGHKSKRTR